MPPRKLVRPPRKPARAGARSVGPERAIAAAIEAWRASAVTAEVERAPEDARLLLRVEAEALAAEVAAAVAPAAPGSARKPARHAPETLREETPAAAMVRVSHVLALRQALLDSISSKLPAGHRAPLVLRASAAIDGRLTWLARAAAEETASLGATLLSLRGLFENLRDGLIFLDRDGVVQDLNRSAVEHSGREREEIVGRRFLETWPSPPDRPFEPVYRRVLDEGATETLYDVEFQPRSRAAVEQQIVFDLVVAPRTVGGEQVGTVTIIHYRTEQRELERELRHSEKMASVGQLATGITHELKNLLAGIRGYAEIARDEPREAPRSLSKILQVLDRASRLTEGLLTFARKGRARREPVDLSRLLDETLELGLSKRDRRWIRLVRTEEPDLPLAFCDQNQLQQVLLNLVLNAIEAMRAPTPEGRREGVLTASLARAGDMVEVSIRDTGPGIAPELHRRIFEPFFTTKTGFGPGRATGTGLGLSISRGIVERHGGEILLESAPGAGTRFTVRLPAAPTPSAEAISILRHASEAAWEEPSEAAILDPPEPPATTAEEDRPALRVLVADDEPVIRDIMRRVLRRAGHEVETARSIGRARKLLSEGRFDLLFLDLVIPGMRGTGTLRRFKRRWPELRIVILSGQALGDEALAKVARLTDGFIEKPFPVAAVLKAAAQAAARAGTRSGRAG